MSEILIVVKGFKQNLYAIQLGLTANLDRC